MNKSAESTVLHHGSLNVEVGNLTVLLSRTPYGVNVQVFPADDINGEPLAATTVLFRAARKVQSWTC